MERRSFLGLVGAGVIAAPLLSGATAWGRGRKGKKGSAAADTHDTPRPGKGKGDRPAEVHGEVKLPAWPHGGVSAANNAVLMFRGNPAHTFYGTGPLPAAKPKVRWQHRMEDFPALYYGEPFVWRGTGWTGQPMVYHNHVWVGSQGRNLYCFDAKSGDVRWRLQVSRQIKGSGCLWDNKVYIGCVDDHLRCVDAATGEVIWKLNTGRDLDSSPCVVDGRLYIAGENGHARCLDPLTGKRIWKTFVGGLNSGPKPGSYGSETSPAVADGAYYTATFDGELHQLDALTGAKRWIAKTGDDTDSSPVVAGGLVYVAAEDKNPFLYAFNRENGKEVWKHRMNGGFWGTPAVVGDTLYIGAAGGGLAALDAKSGAERWTVPLKSQTWSSPVVIGDKLLIGDFSGALQCRATRDGALLWKIDLGGRVHSTPAVVDGVIYVGTTGGTFYCIE